MAGNEIKVSNTYKQKNGAKLNAQWLRNATRSLGSTSMSVLQDISPNIYNAAESAASVTKAIRRTKVTSNTIAKAMDNNKYVKMGKRALSNAMKDLKSGNFNNTSRGSGGSEDVDTTYHFGDDSESSGSEGQIHTTINFNPDGLNNINNSIVQQTKYQMQASQANIDAMVATSSAIMAMNQRNAEASLNMLNNINNSLQAIIKYNNENMTKFITTSMTYYEMMGKAYSPSEKRKDERLTGKDLVDGRGSLTKGNLSKILKQNLKAAYQESQLGGMLELVDNFSDEIVKNPLSFVTKHLVEKAIPQALKESTKQLDKTFGNFVTEMLLRTSKKLMDDPGEFGIKGFLGRVLNIDVERTKEFKLAGKINTDAAKFDKITHHAISAEIPKYLRESTAYLRQLVMLNGGDPEKAIRGSQIFNRDTGSYERYGDFGKYLLGSINNAITSSMRSSDFGKSLDKVGRSSLIKDNQKDAYNKLLDSFFVALEREEGPIDISKRGADSDVARIMAGLKGDKGLKRILEESVYASFANGRAGMGVNAARLHAKSARNKRIEELEETNLAELSGLVKTDQTIDDALASVLYGTDGKTTRTQSYTPTSMLGRLSTIERLLDRGINVQVVGNEGFESIHKGVRGPQTSRRNDATPSNRPNDGGDNGEISAEELSRGINDAMGDVASTDNSGKGGFIINAQNHIGNIMHHIVRGDTGAIYAEMGAMFGSGIMSLGQKMNDSVLTPMKKFIFGDKNGEEFSITGKVKEMFGNLKSDMADFILGPKGEDGKRDGKKATVMGFLHEGMESMTKSLFGEEKSFDEIKEQIRQKVQKNSETGLKGAIIGGGIGLASGGILGTLVGGPLTGAFLGTATAIASKSKGFQKFVFGNVIDDEGNVVEKTGKGLISDATQTFFKDNKKDIVGAAGIGAIGGMLTGGGLLGTMVGGPLAGALLGSAVGIAKNSKTFQKFIFGEEVTDEKTGQKKKIGGILSAFNRAFSDAHPGEGRPGKEIAARGTIGAGAGLLLSMFTPLGPIGGAALGLAGSMVASKDKFHELLFGKEEDKGKGTNEGLVNRLSAQISKTVVAPLANIAKNALMDVRDAVFDKVLAPIVDLAEPLAGMARRLYDKVEEKVSGVFDTLKSKLFNVAKGIGNLFRAGINKVLNRDSDKPGIIGGALNVIGGGARFASDRLRASNAKASSKKWFDPSFRTTNEFKDKYQAMITEWDNLSPEERQKFKTLKNFEKEYAKRAFYYGGNSRSAMRKSAEDRKKERLERQAEQKEITNRENLITRLTGGKYSTDSEEARKAALDAYKKSRGYKRGKGMAGFDDATVQQLLSPMAAAQGADVEGEQLDELKEQSNKLDSIIGIAGAILKNTLAVPGRMVGGAVGGTANLISNAVAQHHERKDDYDSMMDDIMNSSRTTENWIRMEGEKAFNGNRKDFSFHIPKKEYKRLTRYAKNPNSIYYQMANEILNENTEPEKRKRLFETYLKNREERKQARQDARDTHVGNIRRAYKETDGIIRGGYAIGTKSATEGYHVVGEQGPEIVRFGGGERVYSNNALLNVRLVDVEPNAAKVMNTNGEQKVVLVGQNGLLATYGTTAQLDAKTDNKSRIEKALKDPKSLISYDWVKSDNGDNDGGDGGDGGDDDEKKSLLDKLGEVAGNLGKALLAGGGIAALFNLLNNEKFQEFLENFGIVAERSIETAKEMDDIGGNTGGTNAATATSNLFQRLKNGQFFTDAEGNIDGIGKGFLRGGRHFLKTALFGKSFSPMDIIKHPVRTVKEIPEMLAKLKHPFKNSTLYQQINGGSKVIKGFMNGGIDEVSEYVAETVGNMTRKGRGILGNFDIFKNVGKKVADTTDNVVDFASEKLKREAAQKSTQKAVQEGAQKAASEAAQKAVVETAQKGTQEGVLEFCEKAIKEAMQNITQSLTERLGKTAGGKIAKVLATKTDNVIKLLKKATIGPLAEFVGKKLAKLGTFIGTNTAVAATGVGILAILAKDAIWMTCGAINSAGKGGAARLFKCEQKVVDWKMRLIASSVASLAETTPGTVVDLVNEIVVACCSYDFICDFATSIYLTVSKDEKDKILLNSQDALKTDYKAYHDSVLEKEWEAWKTDGVDEDKSLTLDQFKEKVKTGEIQADIMGFDQYNDDVNKTLGAHAWDATVGVAKDFAKAASNMGVSKTTTNNTTVSGPNTYKASNYLTGQTVTSTTMTYGAKPSMGLGYGGRGSVPFYSQKDPRWSMMPYEQGGYGETMSNAGCGPAAFAMAASGAGAKIDPVQSAMLMKSVGARDHTGTNWNGINAAAGRIGLNSIMSRNPSTQFVDSQLAAGRPVILSGRSGGYGGSTPFTSQGHYVVATGKDSNGNYIINDPNYRGGQSRRYNKRDIMRETGAAWGFGGRGLAGEGNRAMDRKEYNKIVEKERNLEKWISICRAVKQIIANYGVGYSTTNYVDVTLDGKTVKNRTDCSGYVCTCLEFYGIDNQGWMNFSDMNNSILLNGGFSPQRFQSFEGLKEGDIVANPDHVMIFAYAQNNRRFYYNCGSHNSNNSPTPTDYTSFNPTVIWKPGAEGEAAISNVVGGEMGNVSYGTGTTSTGGASALGFFGKISTFFSELGNRAIEGLMTGNWNTDWSGVFDGGSTSSGGSYWNGTSTGILPSAAKGVVTGSADEKALFKKLISSPFNLTKAGAAGLMGNLYAESNLRPNNMENSYESKLGLNDITYTNAVDNGSYANFVNDKVGYGLAQWTSAGRKQGLLDLARRKGHSISSTDVQTEHLINELKSGYKKTYQVLTTTDNVREASDMVLHDFERPADQSVTMEEKRASNGMAYFEKYANMGATPTPNGVTKKEFIDMIEADKAAGGYGGYGDSVYTSISNPNKNSLKHQGGGRGATDESVIVYLKQILHVLGESSDKLNALNYLKNISNSAGGRGGNVTNNTFVGQKTPPPVKHSEPIPIPKTDAAKYTIAQKIARGGL